MQKNLNYPPADALGEHFQKKSTIENEAPFLFNNEVNYVPVLDAPILPSEIHYASI